MKKPLPFLASPLIFIALWAGNTPVQAQQINSFTPKTIIGGTGTRLQINGTGFGNSRNNSYVAFVQDNGQYNAPALAESYRYLSWTDTRIELEMPNAYNGKIKVVVLGKESISSDSLHVGANLGYRQVNPLLYDLLSARDGNGGITWYIHRSYWNLPEARNAIAEVVREFRCKTGVNYRIAPLLTDTPLNLGSNIHLIAPDSALGVVGFNDRLWTSCILGSETFFTIQTQLIRLGTRENWYFGTGTPPSGKAKFRYVLMHEMGHSLGLGHVDEPGQTMFPSVTLLPSSNWSMRDSITTAEKTAIGHYVSLSRNFSFRACGILPLSAPANCQDVYADPALSIQANALESLRIYPNPARDQVRVEGLAAPAAYRLLDLSGRVLAAGTLRQREAIPLPTTAPGWYLLHIAGQAPQKLLIE
ncbi:MAG: matrixin family metalloprotease [Bacteroidota bacterium]